MLYPLATFLYWVAFCGLLMASVVYVLELVRNKPMRFPAGRGLSLLSWISLTASIGLFSSYYGGTQLTGPNTLVLLAWVLIIVHFVVGHFFKFSRYGFVTIPAATFLLFVAQIIVPSAGNLAPNQELISAQLDSGLIGFHVLLIMISYALFLIASLAVLLYLYQARCLRLKKSPKYLRSLPSLANMEKLWVRVLTVSLPIFFAGLILGVTRAIGVDVQGWFADIRIILSGLILIVYSLALLLYYRGKTATVLVARIILFASALVLVLMVLARTLPTGFHVFGVFS